MDEIIEKEEIPSENAPLLVPSSVIKVGQEQIHDLLFSDRLSWQAIIYDLINTEQLDPWDLDIVLLSNKYLEKVRMLEEADFFVSSKVLYAASLLLRIKADILLNDDLQGLDDILFGKKETKKYVQERIELEDGIPGLVPRTPMPRFRKVTLAELMSSLNKAIATENRRIRKVVVAKQYEREAAAVLPKNTMNLKDKIAEIYDKLLLMFENREEKLAFSEISGEAKHERIYSFVSLLHLDNQQKVWLEQNGHFDEIWILLKHLYDKKYASELARMREDVEQEFEKLAAEDEAKMEDMDKKPFGGKRGKKKKGKEPGELADGTEEKEEEVSTTGADEFNTEKVENYEELENSTESAGFDSVVEKSMLDEVEEPADAESTSEEKSE